MKKKIVSILASLAMGMSMISLNPMVFAEEEYCPFSGGTGTVDNPYQIATAYDLRLLSELVNNPDEYNNYSSCYYIQTADIDLKNVLFSPIGIWIPHNLPFKGHYNGNFHSIKNLNIDSGEYTGLFGILKAGSEVSNLNVYGKVKSTVTDTDWSHCGGIVGELSQESTVKNCSFNGNIEGNGKAVGGIAGQFYTGGNIISCYFNGTIEANEAGGIIGRMNCNGNETVKDCYAVATGNNAVNPIVGSSNNVNENFSHAIQNNYYLDTMITDNANIAEGCQSLDSDSLKNVDRLLGSPFMHNDSPELNDGYPVFEWQIIPYQFKGSGTAEDPYQISSKEELEKMRDLVNSVYFNPVYGNAHYIQTADIDLQNEKWTPIGTCCFGNNVFEHNATFRGMYDGNYHKITNLYVDESNEANYVGLFGRLGNADISATVKNLNVWGSVKSDTLFTGGICGEVSYNSQISCCSFNGNVNGRNYVGGITGKTYRSGNITSCYHIGTIEGESNVGGILGYADSYKVTIENCYHVGEITATNEYAGAIVGMSVKTEADNPVISIKNCYALNGDCKNNVTVNGTTTENYALVRTRSELKSIGSDLGGEYINSPDGGYPVFYWQTPMGDVNLDGEFGVADIVATQKWLHRSGNMAKWQKADMNGDGKINVVDLCLMKRLVLDGKK